VNVRPIAQLDGDAGFAEIFFDDVFVPDADVLGSVGDGWRVAMSTAGNERGLSLRSPGRFCAAADRLVDLWRDNSGPEDVADAVAQAWIGAEAYRLYTWATVTRVAAGGTVGPEGSVNKIFWSELDVQIHETALDLLGAAQELRGEGAVEAGRWMDDELFALAGPIYAGTNEIQRSIIGERLLGLPRPSSGRGSS
jgi:alkylation response protein AidB-like acyl-CoA dehydrogenase